MFGMRFTKVYCSGCARGSFSPLASLNALVIWMFDSEASFDGACVMGAQASNFNHHSIRRTGRLGEPFLAKPGP